jgi:predicted transcriptional regulator
MARLTVQFPERTNQILKELAEKDEISKTEVLRRALALYKYLENEVRQEDGRKIAVANKDDKILKEIVMTK